MYVAVVIPALSIIFLEFRFPYRKNWLPKADEFKQDLLYLFGVQLILILLVKYMLATYLVNKGFSNAIIFDVWPNQWPLFLQFLVMILLGELMQYWWHRLSHKLPVLWALHDVHHQPKNIYSLNTGRFHPIDKIVEFFADILVFVLIGATSELIAFYYVFYAVNGLLQHANLRLNFGYLNYIFATVENHRLHHDINHHKANCNYGNNCMIWDHVFGSYRHYSNKVTKVGTLDIAPNTFIKQIFHPLSRWGLLNLLIKMKTKRYWSQLVLASSDPLKQQQKTLSEILGQNETTLFGIRNTFKGIASYTDFQKNVPIAVFSDFSSLIEKSLKSSPSELVNETIVYLAKSSGTTGEPKNIPATLSSLKALARSQQISVYSVLSNYPEVFWGDSFVLVDNEIEDYVEQTPAGSMSGKIYAQSPRIIKNKNTVIKETYLVGDYHERYFILAATALCSPNVSLFSTANPSTLIKLTETMNKFSDELCQILQARPSRPIYSDKCEQVLAKLLLKTSTNTINCAIEVLQKTTIKIKDYFPNLRIIFCWMKGSCGYPLAAVIKQLPNKAHVVEVGLVSSEYRATVNVDAKNNLCIPLLNENFYEFIEPALYDNGCQTTNLIHELSPNTEYYIIVTTRTGLYRYFINDIVRTGSLVNKTYSLDFVRKGRGCTNITGEKLTEHDFVSFFALAKQSDVRFFLAVCYPQLGLYKVFYESTNAVSSELLHSHLCDSNKEYKHKTDSGRLPPIEVVLLKAGSGIKYEKTVTANQSRYWQSKYMHLISDHELPLYFEKEVMCEN
ncbi:hypothetical protein CXF85_06185 [Colwellia sp. 75C3]|nr:hypothetical protein CXF85_06185 [Colwellia sp. 75C3]